MLSSPEPTAPPAIEHRRIGHVLVVAAALALIVSSAFTSSRPADPRALGEVGRGGSTTPSDAPLPDWMVATGGVQTLASRSNVSLPEWVLCQQDTGFWSGPDDQAQLFSILPVQAYLQPLGPALGGRLLAYYEGDGGERLPGQGWVDARALSPTDPPPWVRPATEGPTLAFQAITAPAPAQPAAPARVADTPPPSVTARYVAIVDEASGALLYGRGQDTRVPPASTTKIATTLVALNREGDLQRRIPTTISGSAMAARDGSSIMGLEPGDETSLETLLYGMMLPSGNDAAEQVAVALGGTRERYVGWMNNLATSLGLRNTQFVSPSGMDAPGHYSSAYDMALLARAGMRNESFRKMAGAQYFYADGYSLKNANRLIGYYAGADGVKIGFTDAARKTIVASATRNGHRVYVSLMRSEDLPGDSTAMFEWVWQSFQW